jgi:mannosyltransferase OCH1-like enzyme
MRYVESGYEEMMKRSYRYPKQDHSLPDWKVIRTLYEKNYVRATDTTQRIPKKIHQIWLGSELPLKYKIYCNTWQEMHPDWEYKLWRDKDVEELQLDNGVLYEYAKNLGQKSDILRYDILRKEGGLYVDTDFECLKPFDDLLYLDFFVGIAYDNNPLLYCGLFGSTPHNEIICNCVDDLNTPYNGNDANTIMHLTGPEHITRSVLKSVDENTRRVVAFPMDFFYPFPNDVRFTGDAYAYIKPWSYAVHHWKTSWL